MGLRRARKGLDCSSRCGAPGGDHWVRKLSGRHVSLASFWSLLAGTAGLAADESNTRNLGRPRRSARGARPPRRRGRHRARPWIRTSRFRPTPATAIRSAFDAGARPTERRRFADFAGSGEVRCRCCCPSTPRLSDQVEQRAGEPPHVAVSRADFRLLTCSMRDLPADPRCDVPLQPGAGDGMPRRTFAKPVEVHMTGSILLRHQRSAGGKGEPVNGTAAPVPDCAALPRGVRAVCLHPLRRSYVVSIQCLDSACRQRRLACREAYPVAERFLKALRVAGGLPSRPRTDLASGIAERPAERSPDFSYRPSGVIIANSGFRKQSGRADFNAYSQIRFPLEKVPAFVHSQSFRNRRSSDKPIDEQVGSNTSYPWQDNLCEARSFGVGQCPGGFGHQGQDIRPAPCAADNAGPDRCDPKQQAVVAVRDGVLIRSLKQQAATLQSTPATNTCAFATCI